MILPAVLPRPRVRMPQVLHVHKFMKKRNVARDAATYSIAVKALGVTGQWHGSFTLLEEMKEAGLQPNAEVYTAVITCLKTAGQSDRANSIQKDMEAAGVGITL